MEKKIDPQHLDVLAFARDACHLQGEGVMADWPRLASEQHGDTLAPGALNWQLDGRTVSQSGGPDQIWLDLRASVQLPMQCQRCLTPVLETVEAERSFRFVADETTAAAEDNDCEEDLLPLEPRPSLYELLEDELLMALPLVPMHDACPVPVSMQSGDVAAADGPVEEQRPHPFAALSRLKK